MFWDTFWATMWGALGGAVVGALASWLFALDLARRSKEGAQNDAIRRGVARIVDALHAFVDEVGQRKYSYGWGLARTSGIEPKPITRRAFSALLASVDGLIATVSGPDREVLTTVSMLCREMETATNREVFADELVMQLLDWRPGEAESGARLVRFCELASEAIQSEINEHD